MNIGLSLLPIQHQAIGGVESAVYNLVGGFADLGVRQRLFHNGLQSLSPEFVRRTKGRDNISFVEPIVRSSGSRFFQELILPFRRRDDEYLLFTNYFYPPRTLLSRWRGGVIIHDFQHRVLPANFSRQKRAWLDLVLPFSLRSATQVFFISDHERRLALTLYGARYEKKCHVIYNAIDWSRYSGVKNDSSGFRRPYILCVSHQFPHKNIGTLVRAFASLATKNRDVELRLVGRSSREVEDLLISFPVAIRGRVHLHGFVPDAELGRLYAGAAVFAMPSLYEGFGMPAVEAIGMGIPTIAASRAATPEVTRGLAELVEDACDVQEWETRLTGMLINPRRLSADAVQAFRNFYSPAAVARRALSVIES